MTHRFAMAVMLLATPALAQVAAAPLHSEGRAIAYPRLTQFPDAAIKAKVNAVLAAQEKDDRGQMQDCISQLRDAEIKHDPQSYQERIRLAYLSRRYLSIEVHTGYYCGGPYPTNDAPAPRSFDLTKGAALDWNSLFKPGFITAPDGKKAGLWALYQARYRNGQDKDCADTVARQDDGGLHLWLDSKRGGLVAQPDFPHVMEACAEQMVFKPAELAKAAKSEFLADLNAIH